MSRHALVSLLGLGLLAACTWPPTLPSTPSTPNPGQAVNDTANQATGALPAAQVPPAPAVPRVSAPAVSVPRMGGGLLRR